jgi:hypothetical protein
MTRLGLTGSALVTSVLLASDPVAAQSQSDADKIERLERQVNLLQKQLTALQGEIRQTKKKTEPTQPPRHPQTQQAGEQQVGEETRPAGAGSMSAPGAFFGLGTAQRVSALPQSVNRRWIGTPYRHPKLLDA